MNADANDNQDDFGLSPVDQRPTGGTSDHVRQALAEKSERQKKETREGRTNVPDLLYPFGLVGLGGLIPMVLWAAMAGGLWGMTLVWGQQIGLLALRALLPASTILSVIATLYGAACCVAVIQATGNGTEVQDWPAIGEWKEWAYDGLFVIVVLAQLLLLSAALTWWAMGWTIFAPLPLALLFLPLGLLSAAESGNWTVYSPTILRTVSTRPDRWLMMFGQWTAMLLAVGLVSWGGVLACNWWFLVVACPLLATALLIGARLLGRLACDLSELNLGV